MVLRALNFFNHPSGPVCVQLFIHWKNFSPAVFGLICWPSRMLGQAVSAKKISLDRTGDRKKKSMNYLLQTSASGNGLFKLPAPLKAAILAIVNPAANKEGQ